MLEILGFIALIAIIFGVSMTAAVGIIVKAILWVIGVCAAIAIVSKMQAGTAKTLGWIAVIAGGCLLAGMDSFQNNTYAPCFNLNTNVLGWEVYADCMSGAAETIEARNSTAIWLIVIGVVLLIAAWVKGDNSNNNVVNKNQSMNNTETKEESEKREAAMRRRAEAMGFTVMDKSQQIKEEIADLTKALPSLKKKKNIGLWITGISFIIGPVTFITVLFLLPNEAAMVIYSNDVLYNTIKIVSVINIFIFPFFLALTPYWIIKYRGAKKELEELKSTLKKNRKA